MRHPEWHPDEKQDNPNAIRKKNHPMPHLLEICCESVQSALLAQQGGAGRVELCCDLMQGGLTPSAGQIEQAKAQLQIPVMVLIRPRKADFLYSELEFEQMLADIRHARRLGADGIVSGVLLANGQIDRERLRRLVAESSPLPFTFHRAFDMCADPLAAIDELAKAGVQRILTSGQRPTAQEGLDNLRRYAEHAAGRLSIMACGELLPENLEPVLAIPGITEVHAALRRTVHSQMAHRGGTNMGDEAVEEEFSWHEADLHLVRAMSQVIRSVY